MTTAAQTVQTVQVYRVYINAKPQAVWDAITKPEWTRRFGYGGDAEYDLRPGGKYRGLTSAEMRATGSPDVAAEGEIIEADPPRKLVQTWRMLMDPGMAAEGFSQLTYEIDERGAGVSVLTVTHDLTNAPLTAALMGGAMADQGAGGGWNYTLSALKTLLETGESLSWAS